MNYWSNTYYLLSDQYTYYNNSGVPTCIDSVNMVYVDDNCICREGFVPKGGDFFTLKCIEKYRVDLVLPSNVDTNIIWQDLISLSSPAGLINYKDQSSKIFDNMKCPPSYQFDK